MGKDSPLLVEFFGQPGSGKSTLARAAATGFELRTRKSLRSAWADQPHVIKLPLLGRSIFEGTAMLHAIQLALKARLFRGDSLSRLFRLVIKSHWIRRQGGRLLLEEGCLQDLWSICYSAGRTDPDPRQLAPLIRSLYRGVRAQIIFLKVDPQNAFDRIRGRNHGKSRLDRLAETELRQQLAKTAQLPHRLADAARLAGLSVETIDASLPVEASVHRLRTAIQELDLSTPG